MKLEVKEIKLVEPPKEYVLTLTQGEADALITVLGYIGRGFDGDPTKKQVRETADQIYYALKDKTKALLTPTRSMYL